MGVIANEIKDFDTSLKNTETSLQKQSVTAQDLSLVEVAPKIREIVVDKTPWVYFKCEVTGYWTFAIVDNINGGTVKYFWQQSLYNGGITRIDISSINLVEGKTYYVQCKLSSGAHQTMKFTYSLGYFSYYNKITLSVSSGNVYNITRGVATEEDKSQWK